MHNNDDTYRTRLGVDTLFPAVTLPLGYGRGILVAPGFCPAAGVRHPASRFLVGAKTTGHFFLKF